MAQFAFSNFDGTPGDALETYDPLWVRNTTSTSGVDGRISTGLEARGNSGVSGAALYLYNVAPTGGTADYRVTTPVHKLSDAMYGAGPCARILNSTTATFYHARWYSPPATDVIQLFRFNAGTPTQLGADYPDNLTVGDTQDLTLEVIGATINVYARGNPTPVISVTDPAPLVTAGFAGLRLGYGGASIPTDSTCLHLAYLSGETIGGTPVNDLTIGSISSAAALGAISITQGQNLLINPIVSQPVLGDISISIGAAVSLTLDALASLPSLTPIEITVADGDVNLVIAQLVSRPYLLPAGVEVGHNNALVIKKLIGS